MTAPERIWTAPTDGKCHVGFDTPSLNYTTEYIRADLAAVQPAKVRVKPLVWGGLIAGSYRIQIKEGGIANLWYYSAEMAEDGEPTLIKGGYLTLISLEDLKAAAQADYEARILAAIEPQPDPRDEVLNQAMKDAITMGEGWIRTLQDGTLQLIDPSAVRLMPDATDPRDEVIARLVEALGDLTIVADRAVELLLRHSDFKVHAMEPLNRATASARAALAAAKAVQK